MTMPIRNPSPVGMATASSTYSHTHDSSAQAQSKASKSMTNAMTAAARYTTKAMRKIIWPMVKAGATNSPVRVHAAFSLAP